MRHHKFDVSLWVLLACGLVVARASVIRAEPVATTTSSATVVTYPAPAGEPRSANYLIDVNGKPVDVYLAKTQWHGKRPYSFAYFDFSGEVTVTVRSDRPVDHLAILPAKYGIRPAIVAARDGYAVSLTVNRPFKISFEPNGADRPLLLFGNPVEVNPLHRGDPNVVYFGPGISKPTRIELSAGQTLYIAGGAVVKAAVSSRGDNIHIMGRGILDGTDWPHSAGPESRMVMPQDGHNIAIQDIIVRGAWNWTVAPSRCDQVSVTNLKICGSRVGNDDGIDPCNSSNVRITDCFVHTDDDGIAVKGTAVFGQDPKPSENIVVTDCTFWVDFANIFRIGAESRATGMRNISVRNIDVIHALNPNNPNVSIFYLHPAGNMPMENICFEDIRISGENRQNLVRLTPMVAMPSARRRRVATAASQPPTPNGLAARPRGFLRVPGDGPYIHNVVFKNIDVFGPTALAPGAVHLEGLSPSHDVRGISFQDVRWYGQPLLQDTPGVLIGKFVSQVDFQATTAAQGTPATTRPVIPPASQP